MASVNETSDVASVSNCYVFKSRLQEYAQNAGLTTPIYHTIKEGPSHQPVFSSIVVINEETYHSLTGFMNRKASEQSAAEVALIEIAKFGATDKSVSHPVHETGLCKNLLQEYAQKMNYTIPLYVCAKDEKKGRDAPFSRTVDIGGIKYIGGTAKTKTEAQLKAAKTALLAIKMSAPEPNIKPDTPNTESIYTVVLTKRKTPERPVVEIEEKLKTNKRKKCRIHKRRKKDAQTPGVNVMKIKGPQGEVKDSKEVQAAADVFEGNTNGSYLIEAKDLKEVQPAGDGFEVKTDSQDKGQDLKDIHTAGSSYHFLGEIKDCKSKGEIVLVPCSNPGEDWFLNYLFPMR